MRGAIAERAFATRGAGNSHGELHDGVDDVAVVVLEGLDGAGAAHAGLRHDDVDLLLLQARRVHLAVVLLGSRSRHRLRRLRRRRRHRRRSLGRVRRRLLELGLAEDDEGRRVREAVHLRLRDAERQARRLADLHAQDALLRLQAEAGHSLGVALRLLAAGLRARALRHVGGRLQVGAVLILLHVGRGRRVDVLRGRHRGRWLQ
mmetsp:Transcript_53247/g.163828  ORF Transcript_53247/g.163828 Transcript_53247/m.163828 type:complete len:204 (-) Transcript_53247:21-632(-)